MSLHNLALMTIATGGTGAIRLAGAATVNGVPYLTFAQSGVVDGETIHYSINDVNGSEAGSGVWTAATKTLTRTVVNSTNSNNPINVSDAALVSITPLASDLNFPTIVIGSTPISGGTSGRILYDNAGIVGELAPAALTKTDDTNVTLTLGGTPATALLQATSLTLGWTGQLALSRGGTNANLTASNGGIFYSTATAGAILAGTATARQMLQSGASGAPAWSTAIWPATTTINQLLYSSSANTVTGLATANSAVLVTDSGGIPSWSTTGLPTTVFANPTASVGLSAVNGSAVTAMRSDGAPALSQAIAPTWTAAHRWVPSASGFPQPIYSQTSLSGSAAAPTGTTPNLFYIPADTYAAGAAFVNGVSVSHIFGGSAATGGRQALSSFLQLSAATNASNTNRNYVAGQFTAYATAGDNGTNTGAGALGAIFGASSWGDLQSGATNYLNVTSHEFDISIRTGGSAKYKTGIQVVSHALDAVAGASVDAAIAITKQTGGLGFLHGIDFSDFGGDQPVKSTGTLIGTSVPNSTALTAAHGVDLSAYTFSSDAFKSTGFTVDGSGNISGVTGTLTAGTLASGANVLSITATHSATSAAQNAIQVTITGAGSDTNNHVGATFTLAAGYTGAGLSSSLNAGNASAGTGTTLIPAANSNVQLVNNGGAYSATGVTAGYNVGMTGKASNSSALNAGGLFLSQVNSNGAKNIGIVASAINGGSSPVQVGGWLHLNQTTLPTVNAALIADNGSQTDPIARFQDNGTDVFSINDGATVTMSAAFASSVQAGISYPFIVGGSVAVDFNATNTDHAITITCPTTNYRIQGVVVVNSGTTASLTTARGGLFTATGGGGTAVVADQAMSALTSNAANTASSLTNIASAVNAFWNRTGAASYQWRTSTAQGAAATGKVYVMIQPLP